MTTQTPVIVLGRSLALVNALSEALEEYQRNGKSDRVQQLESFLPHGSGIDSGTKIDLDKSKPDKIVLKFDFHHMDENGFYDGWSTDWTATITPTFQVFHGIDIHIKSGKFSSRSYRNKYNDYSFKDYLYSNFYHILGEPIVHAYDQTNHKVVYLNRDYAKRRFPDSNIWKA